MRYSVATYKFSLFSNLLEKNPFIGKTISKCRENGNDRLLNKVNIGEYSPRIRLGDDRNV